MSGFRRGAGLPITADDGTTTVSFSGPSVATPIGTTPHAVGFVATPDAGGGYAFALAQAAGVGNGAILSRRAYDGSHGEVVESITSGPAAASTWSVQFYGNTTMLSMSHDNVTPKLGFYNAAPVARAAHPVTLADVITLLTNLGLCA